MFIPFKKINRLESEFEGFKDKLKMLTEEAIVGKTINSCEIINAEFGRTYNQYICLTFTDGTRHMIGGMFECWSPRPTLTQMKAAPNYFTEEEIEAVEQRILWDKKEREKEDMRKKRAEYERLKKELGE